MTSATNFLTRLNQSSFAPTVKSTFNALYSEAASYVQSVTSRLLPTDQPTEAEALQSRITQIQGPDHLLSVKTEVRSELLHQMDRLISEYHAVCGKYFEDPQALIDQSWKTFQKLESAYNATHSTPYDFQATSCSDPEVRPVFDAHSTFRKHCERAQEIKEQLSKLGSSFQSDPELAKALQDKKRTLLDQNQVLCGDNADDPTSSLYQAWRSYQSATPEEADSKLQLFHTLDSERKAIESNLILLNRMIESPVPSKELTLDNIASQKIKSELSRIEGQLRQIQIEEAAYEEEIDSSLFALTLIGLSIYAGQE
ncbi:MAG: hypothetical protein JSR39_00535 [Verrucomicrobia bacterium]|nr:hypothetical protein [Verrucomicrobiota bacterium]